MPKVSIIIAAQNKIKSITATLESVFRQSYRDYEVLLMDDGAQDSLAEVLTRFRERRLRVFHDAKGGVSTLRNRGIDRATGEYVIFLNAGEIWTSDKLGCQVEALERSRKMNPSVGAAYSWNYQINEVTHECLNNPASGYIGNILVPLLTTNFMAHSASPMVLREAIEATGKFRTDLSSAEDWDYWIRLARSWEFVLVPKRQVFCQQIPIVSAAKVEMMEQDQVSVIDAAFSDLSDEFQPLKRIALSNIYFDSAQIYARLHPDAQSIAQSKLWRSIYLYPQRLLHRNTQRMIQRCTIQRFSKHQLEIDANPFSIGNNLPDLR
jgi:glycosyltransferase involved in cell wall biosynthesis